MIGATAGWGVDGFDFVLYSFVMPTLIVTWHMTHAQAGLIVTVSLLTSALGGWIAGVLADRYGRVRILQLTIIWFSACTFLSAFTHSFVELATIRALQGFGFGGEWAVGAVLVAEMISAKNRAKALGVMQSGYAVGWALATGTFSLFFSWLPPDQAWRALFLVGILPAALVIYLRACVTEPPLYLRSHETRPDQREVHSITTGFVQIFSPTTLRTLVLASLLTTGIQAAYYSLVTWLPTYLVAERHLTVLNTGRYLFILITGSFLGYLVGGSMMDVFGRRRSLITFASLSACACILYFSADLPEIAITYAGFPLGFAVSAMIGGMGAYLAELFPTYLRGSAQGFTYNFGRIVAAAFPPLIGQLSAGYALSSLMLSFALGSFGCVIVASLLLPETKGRDL